MFKKIVPIIILIFVSCGSQKSNIVRTNSERKSNKINDVFADKSSDKKSEHAILSNPILDEAEKNQQILAAKDTVKPKEIAVKKDTLNNLPDEFIKDNPVKIVAQEPIIEKPVLNENSNNIQVLTATTTVKVTRNMVENYIEKYKQIAKDEMVKYKIPASITLAQAILESGSGTGPLSIQANNHFGIKCKDDWKGESIKYTDDAPNECFRKYNNPNLSFEDHSIFLASRPWYNNLFKLPIDDYKAWARGLKSSGYATDVKYPEKLIAIIESYKLTQYDAEVLGKVETIIINKPNEIDIPVDKPIENQTTIDSENTYTVQPKDGLYSISKKFNLTVDQLKKLNNLTDNNISIGQVLKIK